ncbi:MAG: hypothetical protein CME32_19225 [Gimesia sp.]|uniref:Uncharacterized protein n=1 Tax=Gimesia chilikensis TaxID=2605989 RepID=A0A517PSP5_9PLAN|nr:hypothetical protein [Gimesia chilikensis]MBN71401.1 hypothetical protein [Gimesia sp.]QDT22395.1 hypothetical protein HG66A1_42030 [Gimesia chilikensis]
MTIPRYGQLTPLQSQLLRLGGADLSPFQNEGQVQDRVNSMRRTLSKLKNRTGRDFGYDLEEWHHFLESSDEFSAEYTCAIAWDAVFKNVNELIDNPERLQLVELAQKLDEDENIS